MDLAEMIVGIVGVTTCGSMYRAYLQYKQKAMEARIQNPVAGSASAGSELSMIRHQMNELRDVTTQYDMSFEATLQSIESRVRHLESRVSSVEQTETRQVVG